MSDKKTELVAPTDKSAKTGDGVKKSALIGDDQNQGEFQKAHKKSHSKDQSPSDLHPAMERFGIDGDVDQTAPGGKPVDSSWRPEGGPDLGDTVRKVAGTEQEKAVLSRRHFLKLLDENETNKAEKQQVIDAMHKFEKLHSTNPKEIKEFYEQISRMMDKQFLDVMKAVPQQKRVILAEQTILQAANPDLIRQGDHNTCNVATIEYRMYCKHPSAAAKMVADLALDSKWESGSTKVNLVLYKDCFLAETGTDNLTLGRNRSFASQIFQIGAVNVHYAEAGKQTYVQEVDKKTHKHEEVLVGDIGLSYKPNLTNDELINVYNKIAHTHDEKFILTQAKTPSSEHCLKFKSQEELGNYLFKHQKEMPLVLVVQTANEPFWSDGEAGSDTGGPHVVTIKSYDPVKRTAAIHNQWGPESDHAAMPLAKIYNSTLSPGETINRLQELENNDKISVNEKLDLARLRWVYDAEGDANGLLGQDLIDCMKDARNRWKTQHTSAEEQSRDWKKYGKILKLLSDKMFDNGVFVNRIKKEVGH